MSARTGADCGADGAPRPAGGEAVGAEAGSARGAGEDAGLGNPGNLPDEEAGGAPSEEAKARRRWVYQLRERARGLQPKGPGCCGTHATQGQLSVVSKGGRASVTSVQYCAMIWRCPVCAMRVAARRAQEITEALAAWHERDGRVSFVTLTIAHQAGDSLDELMRVHTEALSMLRDRVRRRWKERIGRVGDIMNWEVTHGAWHGWHPHRHLLVFHRELEPPEWVAWYLDLSRTWADCVATVSPRHKPSTQVNVGVKIEPVPVADAGKFASYMSKDAVTGAAWEVSNPEGKAASGESRTPFHLLDGAVSGDRRARELWDEYALASRRKFRVRFSTGLKPLLGMTGDQSDEDLANEVEEGVEHICDLDEEESALVLWAPEVTPYCL